MRRSLPFLLTALPWRQARPWVWALGLSSLAHGLLLLRSGDDAPAPGQPGPRVAVTLLQAPAPAPQPAPSLQPLAEPAPTAAPRPRTAPSVPAMPTPTPAPAPANVALPLAAEWTYRLLQNGQQGIARLSWQPTSEQRYTLRLERELAQRPLPAWFSQGGLSAQGLAPDRFAQQRRGRDSAATNFRRDEGLISFSASAEQFALPPGVQDRLSWWLQLAAQVNAAPQRFVAGTELRLPVVGLRGAAAEWIFEVVGLETLGLAGGSLGQVLHLRRATLGAYGGEVEVWLDPARAHLPVRLIVGRPDERGWELQLVQDDSGKP